MQEQREDLQEVSCCLEDEMKQDEDLLRMRRQRSGAFEQSTSENIEDLLVMSDEEEEVGVVDHSGESEESLPITQSKVLYGLKWSVIFFLAIAAAVIGSTSFVYTRAQEQTRFEDNFRTDAERLVARFFQLHSNKLLASIGLFGAYIAAENYDDNVSFPNVTLPEFDLRTSGYLQTSQSSSFFFAPLLSGLTEREVWESYANQSQLMAGISGPVHAFHNRTIEDGIFKIDESSMCADDLSMFAAPIWQISPYVEKRHLHMFNLISDKKIQRTLAYVQASRIPLITDILDDNVAEFFSGTTEQSPPKSLYVFPVLNERNGQRVVGFVGAETDWLSYWQNVTVAEQPDTDVILRNTCGNTHTFTTQGGNAIYRGEGDMHNPKFETMRVGTEYADFVKYWRRNINVHGTIQLFHDQDSSLNQLSNTTRMKEMGLCTYAIDIYPTSEYEERFRTSTPITYMLTCLFVFVSIILLFYLYDFLVERRQSQVMRNAASAQAMVKSLFPAVVREKLFRLSAPHNQRGGRQQQHRSSKCGRRNSLETQIDDSGVVKLAPKIRLARFLTGLHSGDMDSLCSDNSKDEPIAEMFSNTTVMFADIAGFTAWSSEREPTQVFKLLETIYAAFDALARRLVVFKVETIGDCYVAVVGLPEPNNDHAIVCAKFAHQCILAMNRLTKELELTLGPGTSELGLRIGLHSGPVTAGVLRGEKSRFQLFGDTMNTASRMESTGQKGRIQVSQETADLIRTGGRQSWLKARTETVTAKGKGEMQTFWLKACRPSEHGVQQRGNQLNHHSTIHCAGVAIRKIEPTPYAAQLYDQQETSRLSTFLATKNKGNRRWDGSDDVTIINETDDRLIDWNVEVLMGFLEKIVQLRYETPTQAKHRTRPLSQTPPELIIDEVVEVIELPDFTESIRTKRSVRLAKLLPSIVRAQMKEFVTCIAGMYRDVPFHNFLHASHVTMSANKLMKRIITPNANIDDGGFSHNAEALHASTFGISSDPLTQFAVVFSALIHDVDHTGLSNTTLVERDFDVARKFCKKSVAEQNSVSLAWAILMQPRFEELQSCIFEDEQGRDRFRQLVVNAVMATDIMDGDMVSRRKVRWEKAFDTSEQGGQVDLHRKATIVIEHIIQASDVAHTMQHWRVFTKWNNKLYRELYRSYKMGFSSKDPVEGWYEGQIGFFDHYVIPLAKKLKECGVFGVSGDEYLQYAQWNRQEWEQKGHEEIRKMIASRLDDDDKMMTDSSASATLSI